MEKMKRIVLKLETVSTVHGTVIHIRTANVTFTLPKFCDKFYKTKWTYLGYIKMEFEIQLEK